MKNYIISGIQQVGIGVEDLNTAWKYYINQFQMDVKILEDENTADIMAPYMGGEPRNKRAVIAINMQGGGGIEIWQHTQHMPQKANFDVHFGDLGVLAAKIKSRDVQQTYAKYIKDKSIEIVGKLTSSLDGKETFFVKDPFGNLFQIVHDSYVFRDEKRLTGGPVGVIMGVSDIEKSIPLYQQVLGYDKVIADQTGVFEDIAELHGGGQQFRRLLLTHSHPRKGSFSRLFGTSYIELVQALDREPRKIYEDRYWGDPGFIQVCFDVRNMDVLKKVCADAGYPFTVDSAAKHGNTKSFDMGEAAGRFTYIEDPDGTLIEFVETHKIPIAKKWGIYLNLQKRDPEKPLKDGLLKLLRLGRIKAEEL